MFQDGSGTGISSSIVHAFTPQSAPQHGTAVVQAACAASPSGRRVPAAPTDADTGRAEPAHPLLPAAASLLAISSPLPSLFKVLFIFPSRYLFAIGLLLIFSFRWNLPPTLSCTRKQLDSLEAGRSPHSWVRTGLAPSLASHSMEVVPAALAWRHSSRLQFGQLPRPIFKLSFSLFTRRY